MLPVIATRIVCPLAPCLGWGHCAPPGRSLPWHRSQLERERAYLAAGPIWDYAGRESQTGLAALGLDLEQELDFNRHPEGERGHADRGAGVAPRLAEDIHEQL